MCNPRNAYQRYNAADQFHRPRPPHLHGNAPSLLWECDLLRCGHLKPDIGRSTVPDDRGRCPDFPGGARGMVVGEGTQHSPAGGFGTLMVTGDMKEMSPEYARAATMHGYGVTLYIGVGIPLPVVDIGVVRSTAIRDEDIVVEVMDYGIPHRNRPAVRQVTYAEPRSGTDRSVRERKSAPRPSPVSGGRRPWPWN